MTAPDFNTTDVQNGEVIDANDLKNSLDDINQRLTGVDPMVAPDIDNPDIDGGTIDNASIGQSAPGIAAFQNATVNPGNNSAAYLTLTRDSGYIGALQFQTGGANRWSIFVNQVEEPGGNTDFGSDFFIARHQDDGSTTFPFSINRSSGETYIDNLFAGTVDASVKSFLIDHPLDPDNRTLRYQCLESPQADVIHRGRVQLVDGEAAVDLDAEARMTPGTFVALTRNPQVFVTNNESWDAVQGHLEGVTLTIRSQNAKADATVEWMVIAERADAYMMAAEYTDETGRLIVEADKEDAEAVLPSIQQAIRGFARDPETGEQARSRAELKGYARQLMRRYKGGRLNAHEDLPDALMDRLLDKRS